MRQSRAIIVMGVTASGKSTLARALAFRLQAPFLEGDDCHPAQNIEKMRAGVPLQDEDRWPWLAEIARQVNVTQVQCGPLVASCSALKRAYRDYLQAHITKRVCFICLEVDCALLSKRLNARTGHFMATTLLNSQLQAFEQPTMDEPALILDGATSMDALTDLAVAWLEKSLDYLEED